MTLAVFNLWHVWHIAAIGLGLLLSVLTIGRAVLNKRGPRAASSCNGHLGCAACARLAPQVPSQ